MNNLNNLLTEDTFIVDTHNHIKSIKEKDTDLNWEIKNNKLVLKSSGENEFNFYEFVLVDSNVLYEVIKENWENYVRIMVSHKYISKYNKANPNHRVANYAFIDTDKVNDIISTYESELKNRNPEFDKYKQEFIDKVTNEIKGYLDEISGNGF